MYHYLVVFIRTHEVTARDECGKYNTTLSTWYR